jgi:hypothetical protein
MARERFKLSCIASSRGSYVAKAHESYVKRTRPSEQTVKRILKPKYYVKCFGRLIQITDMEAAMLRPTMSVIVM